MPFFVDVILPLPLKDAFTYAITPAEAEVIQSGMRIIVPFGKRKRYTAIAFRVHQNPPKAYDPKQIESIIDQQPVLSAVQLSFLEWMAAYYQASLGLVIRTALPSVMLLESETEIVTHSWDKIPDTLSKNALQLLQQIQPNSLMSLSHIQQLITLRNPYPILKELAALGFVSLKEEVYAQYRPKTQNEIVLHPKLHSDEALKAILEELAAKPKQHQTFLTFLQQKPPVVASEFSKLETVSPSSFKTLIKHQILAKQERIIDRLPAKTTPDDPLLPLSPPQQEAKKDIEHFWKTKDITLLHGVTGSGKTAVYMHLIATQLAAGKQVLFLVPEIGLTTQLMQRLYQFFGQYLAVYHSKYSPQERAETWDNILTNTPKTRLVLGARSAVLLPFQNLGLVVVDESHETAYKQYDAAPRYHARDAAMVLARKHNAKVLLGTATPAMESYRHAETGKYGLVSLTARFNEAQMPEISFVDLAEAY
ncbi:MAG: DEAD/DEAH box helicase, partial [Flavobacteriaceae bacterium]